MSCHSAVREWTTVIQTFLPQLSKPQTTVLALWSLGMVLARSCALTAVAAFLAVWLRRQEQTVRQQLRELCYEAKAKRGDQRRALAVEPCFVPLLVWVLSRWQGTGTAFKNSQGRLRCTLLARWEEGYSDPWIILTDLPPEASEAGWYGLRAQIEQGFKVTKRASWQWQRTHMTAPQRTAHLWLAVGVATLWLVSVAGAAEETIPESTLLDVSAAMAGQRRQRRATRLRLVSIFRRG